MDGEPRLPRLVQRAMFGLSAALMLGVSEPARAQPTGQLVWQVSADQGVTWASHLTVPQGQAAVSVRLVASWQGVTGSDVAIFAYSKFDGIVRAVGGGLNDRADDFITNGRPGDFGTTLEFNFGPRIAVRQGAILKLDAAPDVDPPGAGSRWVFPLHAWPPSGIGDWSAANPITIFQYRLDLDGSPGRREIDAAYGPFVADTQNLIGLWTLRAGAWDLHPTFVETSTQAASITVIPGVATAAAIVAGLAAFARRHRRAAGTA